MLCWTASLAVGGSLAVWDGGSGSLGSGFIASQRVPPLAVGFTLPGRADPVYVKGGDLPLFFSFST